MKNKWKLTILGSIASIFIGCSENQSLEQFVGTWESTIQQAGEQFEVELQVTGDGKFKIVISSEKSPSTKDTFTGLCKAQHTKLIMKVSGALEGNKPMTEEFEIFAILKGESLVVHGYPEDPSQSGIFHKKDI